MHNLSLEETRNNYMKFINIIIITFVLYCLIQTFNLSQNKLPMKILLRLQKDLKIITTVELVERRAFLISYLDEEDDDSDTVGILGSRSQKSFLNYQ